MKIDLRPDGPHSPEYTAAVADVLTETVRVLNHATIGADGLTYPGDVDRLIAALAEAASRLPQLLTQIQGNFTRIIADRGLYDDRGGDPTDAVVRVSQALGAAVALAAGLGDALDAAHQSSARLGIRSGDDDG